MAKTLHTVGSITSTNTYIKYYIISIKTWSKIISSIVADLPMECSRRTKKNAKGYKQSWSGFKLHVDVNDAGFPLSAVLTSASLHDSQVAIPLIKLTSSKVQYCYDLMNAAYNEDKIWEMSKELGHVPIIVRNPRRGEVVPMAQT